MPNHDINKIAERISADVSSQREHADLISISWSGYLAALLEWDIITIDEHQRLEGSIPPIKDDPVIGILLGRDSEEDLSGLLAREILGQD